MKLLAIALLTTTACSAFRTGTAEGKLEATGELGTWTLEKGTCKSGEREKFHGFIIEGAEGSGIALQVAKDSDRGWSVLVNAPSTCTGPDAKACKAMRFREHSCDAFAVAVSRTNTTVNDIRVLDGKVELDCKLGATRIKGTLTLDHCH